MRSSIFALAATAAMAAEVSVVWRHEKTTGRTSLTIESADDAILAETCGSSMGDLEFNANEAGSGNFTVGGNKFDITTQSQDGVSCNRIYNPDITVVECSGVKLEIPEAATSADCFTDENAKASFLALKSRSLAMRGPMNVPTPSEHGSASVEHDPSLLRSRQIGCGINGGTEKVGNGNPHQNYYHKQLSETINCASSPSCLVGQSESESFSIGFTFSGSADGWIDAGFSVQKEWTTGNDYQCYGDKGDTVCIWYNTAHTAYTVKPYSYNICDISKKYYKDAGVMKSPNKNNRGGGYYCVIGTCRSQGDNYWDNSGRAGGP